MVMILWQKANVIEELLFLARKLWKHRVQFDITNQLFFLNGKMSAFFIYSDY